MEFTSKVAGLAVAFVVSAAAAHAQVTVAGTTTGCFGAGCTNFASTASFTIDGTNEVIGFAGTSFSGTTNPFTNGFTVGNFGTLILTPAPSGTTPNTTFSTPFSIRFNLTAPPGATSPVQPITISGFVGNTNGQGTRDISYTGGTQAFTFDGGGTGTITIDPGFIGVVATNISGRITANVIPEPSTYALMATGLAGLVLAARRRRSA